MDRAGELLRLDRPSVHHLLDRRTAEAKRYSAASTTVTVLRRSSSTL
jgi:hypothetical protein